MKPSFIKECARGAERVGSEKVADAKSSFIKECVCAAKNKSSEKEVENEA